MKLFGFACDVCGKQELRVNEDFERNKKLVGKDVYEKLHNLLIEDYHWTYCEDLFVCPLCIDELKESHKTIPGEQETM